MEKTTKIVVMRHGEAENNVCDILSSSLDANYHLTSKGRDQVFAKASTLVKSESIDVILASPITRTYETAGIVAECAGISLSSIQEECRLREPYFGKVEGKTYQEYRKAAKGQNDLHSLDVVGGEPSSSMIKRIDELLSEISSKYRGKTVLLVTHSFLMCQMMRLFGKDQKQLPAHADYFIFELS